MSYPEDEFPGKARVVFEVNDATHTTFDCYESDISRVIWATVTAVSGFVARHT